VAGRSSILSSRTLNREPGSVGHEIMVVHLPLTYTA
jgi:hypothetical protein